MSLFEQCFGIIKSAVNGVLPWVWRVYDTMGAWKYIVAALFSMFVIRFLLYPFMKEAVGMGSDRVQDQTIDQRGNSYVHSSVAGTLPPSLRNRKKLKG